MTNKCIINSYKTYITNVFYTRIYSLIYLYFVFISTVATLFQFHVKAKIAGFLDKNQQKIRSEMEMKNRNKRV